VTSPGAGDHAPIVSLQDAKPTAAAPADHPGIIEARGNFIDPNNPRIAWVPLYRRGTAADGTPEPYAQVTIIVLQSRNRPQYFVTPQPNATGGGYWNDLQATSTFPTATLQPTNVDVIVKYDAAAGHGQITFPNLTAEVPSRPAPGAYVVISNDGGSGNSNGRIYQLGNAFDEGAQIWDLNPAGDMTVHATPTPGDDPDLGKPSKPVQAYIVGRGFADPTQNFSPLASTPGQGFAGPAQDIAIYTGFIQISR
jgi:hypothetical protein